jgi:hypothetical protein
MRGITLASWRALAERVWDYFCHGGQTFNGGRKCELGADRIAAFGLLRAAMLGASSCAWVRPMGAPTGL